MNALLDSPANTSFREYSTCALSDNWSATDANHGVVISYDESVYRSVPLQKFVMEIRELVNECAEENWDGYGAKPVDLISLSKAIDFLQTLPSTFVLPEMSVDPDGQVSLDWVRERGRRMSVSVDKSGKLTYAAIFGNSRKFGTEPFTGNLPAEIRVSLERLYG